ncbi:pre-rRNA-processing protein pno1 [Conoideocrella luteorostrata]|uniref:Pre-rRNA-processing protein PNO1 n=1 Tax=Conoideocrella luteorostrata TaxID=1105319 RepID=A0AAJ0CW47_9HYPO|nr:pre-rRNA-processing protein pno1 [Conoideocrella luteorostrata]
MPAPTALQKADETPLQEAEASLETRGNQSPRTRFSFYVHQSAHMWQWTKDDFTIGETDYTPVDNEDLPMADNEGDHSVAVDEDGRPCFGPAKDIDTVLRVETRKIPVPPHRMTPLKQAWLQIYPPLVEHLKLQCRMNIKRKTVELRTSQHTTDSGALQKGEDFVKAFTLGFDVDDAIALLRLDDLYIETFEIKDVRTMHGDSQARAVGRIAGKDGKTKFAIENASRTRIVLADSKIHILGGFKNIHMARESVVSLILGKPPGKVYGNLRTVAARMKERF